MKSFRTIRAFPVSSKGGGHTIRQPIKAPAAYLFLEPARETQRAFFAFRFDEQVLRTPPRQNSHGRQPPRYAPPRQNTCRHAFVIPSSLGGQMIKQSHKWITLPIRPPTPVLLLPLPASVITVHFVPRFNLPLVLLRELPLPSRVGRTAAPHRHRRFLELDLRPGHRLDLLSR